MLRSLHRRGMHMLFYFGDPWYVIIIKISILLLANYMVLRILKSSVWNFNKRYSVLSENLKEKKHKAFLWNFIALLVNFLFVWVLVQVVIVLDFGFIGISVKKLFILRYQEVSFVCLIIILYVTAKRQAYIGKL